MAQVFGCPVPLFVTCERLFNRPEVDIRDLESDAEDDWIKNEDVLIDKDELRNAAESGCNWCDVQWHQFIEQHGQQGCILFTFEEAQLKISTSWRLGSERLLIHLCSYTMILYNGMSLHSFTVR
jgi:hypothetical protein